MLKPRPADHWRYGRDLTPYLLRLLKLKKSNKGKITMGYDMYMLKASDSDTDGYYRANIWGMQKIRQAMIYSGAMDDDYTFPPFPKEDDFETDEQYKKAHDSVLSFRCDDKSKVPLAKFGSNDGWVVVPEECRIIHKCITSMILGSSKSEANLKSLLGDRKDDLKELYLEFADFCKRAARHGGFEVW